MLLNQTRPAKRTWMKIDYSLEQLVRPGCMFLRVNLAPDTGLI